MNIKTLLAFLLLASCSTFADLAHKNADLVYKLIQDPHLVEVLEKAHQLESVWARVHPYLDAKKLSATQGAQLQAFLQQLQKQPKFQTTLQRFKQQSAPQLQPTQ